MANRPLWEDILPTLSSAFDDASATASGFADYVRDSFANAYQGGRDARQLLREGAGPLDILGQQAMNVGSSIYGFAPEAFDIIGDTSGDFIDAVSSGLTGRPLIYPRDEFGNNLSRPIEPGVSQDEYDKAEAKLTNAEAAVMEAELRRQQELQARLEALQQVSKADSKDVYVAKGDEYLSDNTDSKGTFSKTGYGLETNVDKGARELKRLGAPENLIVAYKQAASAENAGQARAAELLSKIGQRYGRSQSEDDVDLIQNLAKLTRDPSQFRLAIVSALRARGRSDDEIRRLLNTNNLR